jgi:hypothetical protein
MHLIAPTKSNKNLPTDGLANFLHHLNHIRRGLHPGFSGDGIYNSDALILRFCKQHKNIANAFCLKIDDATDNELTAINKEFHVSTIRSISKAIKRNFITLV